MISSKDHTKSTFRTLSQSSFCLVSGSALRKPLKVFSAISWYASFKETWYFPSSFSTRARSFSAFCFGGEEMTAGGSANDESWVVDNWTWQSLGTPQWVVRGEWREWKTNISLLIVVHIHQYLPFNFVPFQIYPVLRTPSSRPVVFSIY